MQYPTAKTIIALLKIINKTKIIHFLRSSCNTIKASSQLPVAILNIIKQIRSVTDISQMKKIEHNPKFNCKEPILLILGEKYNDSKVNLILFKDNKQYFYIETE